VPVYLKEEFCAVAPFTSSVFHQDTIGYAIAAGRRVCGAVP